MGVPASSEKADVVLVFGGDGTVHRHLGSLVRLGLPVLVVPAGSGNDFASSLGIRGVRDSVAAWDDFVEDSAVRAIDLGVIASLESAVEEPADTLQPQILLRFMRLGSRVGWPGDATGKSVASLASGTRRLRDESRSNDLYVCAFADRRLRPLRRMAQAGLLAAISLRFLAAFANTPMYGGGMKIAPRAKMDDGLLDVCIVGAVDPFKLFCMFPTVYAGRHLEHSGSVVIFRQPGACGDGPPA